MNKQVTHAANGVNLSAGNRPQSDSASSYQPEEFAPVRTLESVKQAGEMGTRHVSVEMSAREGATQPGTARPATGGMVRLFKGRNFPLLFGGQTISTFGDALYMVALTLAQAQANLVQVRTDLSLARTTAARWKAMRQDDSVSQQDADEKQAAFMSQSAKVASVEAAVLAARSNVSRLETLARFEQVVAHAPTFAKAWADLAQVSAGLLRFADRSRFPSVSRQSARSASAAPRSVT